MENRLGLVLDLSSSGFVAVVDAEDHPLAQQWRPPARHNDDLGEWVGQCLGQAGCGYRDLEWLAVDVGPGSFTGIRIGMAFMQGVAFPRRLPLLGFMAFVPLFISGLVSTGNPGIAAIPANAGRFYVSAKLGDPGAVLDAEQLRQRGEGGLDLIVSQDSTAFDSVRSVFPRVMEVRDQWDVRGLLRYARETKRDALRPYYLMPSAAEAKADGLA